MTTERTQVAAIIMQGMLSNERIVADICEALFRSRYPNSPLTEMTKQQKSACQQECINATAKLAVYYADALIEAASLDPRRMQS